MENEIVFCGLQGNVYPFLQAADCFILPSLYEGMPITLVEAMGCGLPIIASAVGGVSDMIENGKSGILISPNTDQLVVAINNLMGMDFFATGTEDLAESYINKQHSELNVFGIAFDLLNFSGQLLILYLSMKFVLNQKKNSR